jgi:methylmalonyl-CoA mutase
MIKSSIFPEVSKKQWTEKLISDLKGKDIKDVLHYSGFEQVESKAYYHREDINSLSFIGDQFLNGDHLSGKEIKTQALFDQNTSNSTILNELACGINHINIAFSENIDKQLQDVNITYISLTIRDIPSINNSNELITKYKECNRLILVLKSDQKELYPEVNFKLSKQLIDNIDNNNIGLININGADIYEKGGNTSQQICYIALNLLEVLNKYSEELDLEKLINKINIQFALGNNFFYNIAGIRTLRKIISSILEEYNIDSSIAAINTELVSSERELCRRDIHSNILRLTNQAISGVIAGGDSILIKTFNQQSSDESSLRISRNLINLLKEESFMEESNNAYSGSYFIESLTESLLNNSWLMLQELLAVGDFSSQKNKLNEMILLSRNQLISEYKENDKVLIGLNAYKNNMEDLKSIELKKLSNTLENFRLEEVVSYEK